MRGIKDHIFVKLGAGIMILIIAVLIPLSFSIHHFFVRFYTEQVVSSQVSQGQYVEKMIEANGRSLSLMKKSATFNNLDSKLVVVGKNDNVIFNSGAPLGQKRLWNQQLLNQLQQKHTFHQIVSRWIIVGIPSHQKQLKGIFLYTPRKPLQDAIQQFLGMVILAVFGALLMGIGLTWAFSRTIVQPLIKMKQTTKALSHSHFDQRVAVKGNDEIAQLGNAINQLSRELQRVQNSRKAFLSNVSHELRSPLSYIKGYSQAIDEGMINEEQEKEKYVQVIRKEAERMTRLVDDLFDLAQMDEGRLKLEKRVVNLDQILQSMIETVKPQANAKKIHLQYIPASIQPVIIGDTDRLSQVFFNLLDNAIRHTPEKGIIDVRAMASEEKVTICISNSGKGISAEQLPFIWDRFYKGDPSRLRTSGGTGLGLSIVKQLIESHQGTVEMNSSEEAGTTVEVSIPRFKG